MPTKNVTDENFETEVLKSNSPCVVDFWAEWCGPCKQIGPILEEISNEMSNQTHGELDFKTSVSKFSSVTFLVGI
jgi:thioredoxin-like negative regulator of GroEL